MLPQALAPAEAPLSPAGRAALALLAVAGLLFLFGAAMARTVTYDEDQYLAAGLMVAQGLVPFRDFVFLQAPLYPLVLGAAFKLSGGWYLLTGRLLTFAMAAGCGALLWPILRRLGAGPLLAAVLLAACLASPFLASPLANTRNDVLPLLLFLGGLLLHLRTPDDRWLGRLAAALLMGLAAEAKLTYLFAPAALLAHAAFNPGRRLLPVLAGLALAAAPAIALLAVSGTDRMLFGLYEYHLSAPQAWYTAQGLEAQLLWPARLQTVLAWLFLGGNLTLLVLSVALTLLTVGRRRKWKRPGQLLVLMLVLGAVLAFLPAPSWAMYFAVIPPLLACSIAHLDRVTAHSTRPAKKHVLILVAALPIIPALLTNGPELLQAARGRWVGIEAHRTALAVRAALPAPGPVATLFPHLVMDANPILPSLAAGPFIFRTGGLYPPERLARLGAVSAATAPATLAATPPAGVFAGTFAQAFRTPMDAKLTEWAEGRDWRLVLTTPGGGRLWIP